METLVSYPSVVLDSKGWVGIGTTNPQYPFHVFVDTNLSGGGGGGVITSNATIFASNIGIGTNFIINPLTVFGNAYINGTLSLSNLQILGNINFGPNSQILSKISKFHLYVKYFI